MFGTFGNGCMTEPAIGKHVNGNNEEYLSADCTIGYLMQNAQAGAIVGAILSQGQQAADTQAVDEKNREGKTI